MRRVLVVVGLFLACAPRVAGGPPPGAPPASGEQQGTAPPPPDPKSWSKEIKPILAGGVMQPKRLFGPVEKFLQPAKNVFKKLELLGDDRGDAVMAAMESMNLALGVKCSECHVPKHFEEDTEHKNLARSMIKMAAAINAEHFEKRIAVSCFTCHRGAHEVEAKWPEGAQPSAPKTNRPPQLTEAQAAKPAEDVFKNLQVLKGVPAGRVMKAMDAFTITLGTGCDHCHDEADWANDDLPEKETARQMMRMTRALDSEHFEGKGKVTCWTCHRGKVDPLLKAKSAADEEAP